MINGDEVWKMFRGFWSKWLYRNDVEIEMSRFSELLHSTFYSCAYVGTLSAISFGKSCESVAAIYGRRSFKPVAEKYSSNTKLDTCWTGGDQCAIVLPISLLQFSARSNPFEFVWKSIMA